MDVTQIIIIILALAAAWIVFRLLTRFIFKVVLPILILLIGVYFALHNYGPGNLIADVTELYCEGEKMDEVKCECFVKPILSDLESRLSADDMLALRNDLSKSTDEFLTSYKNKKEEINSCFESKGETQNMADDILKDIKELLSTIGDK